ncbi:MAG: hypothetical protein M0014_07590 [Actinomycetota bacterium]|nr:hypothetical protein [Actinomycetota bacterium]
MALIDTARSTPGTIARLAVIGGTGAIVLTLARLLLQRAAPPGSTGVAFAALEAITSRGLAIGAVAVRLAIAVGSVRFAFVAPALVAVVLVALTWRRTHLLDEAATVPQVEIRTLTGIPVFAAHRHGHCRDARPALPPRQSAVHRRAHRSGHLAHGRPRDPRHRWRRAGALGGRRRRGRDLSVGDAEVARPAAEHRPDPREVARLDR